jgi:hypothetical protein
MGDRCDCEIPLIGTIFGVDLFIHKDATNEREKLATQKDSELAALRAEKDAEIAALHIRIGNLGASFNDYRVNSAQLFATVGAVREVKQEIADALREIKAGVASSFGRIEEKVDRLVERNTRKDS